MAEQIVLDVIRKAEAAQVKREPVDAIRERIRRHVQPVLRSFDGASSYGSLDRDQILDNTPETASEMLAAAIHGHLTNPGTQIFDLRVSGQDIADDVDVTGWLEDTTRRAHTVLSAPITGFTTAAPEIYAVLSDFGQSSLFVDLDPKLGAVRIRHRPIDEAYLDIDHDGKVDTRIYIWELTARQAVQRWGNDAGDKCAKDAAAVASEGKTYRFAQMVAPRAERAFGRMGPKNKPVASVVVSMTEKHLVRVSGFDEMPAIDPRWRARAGEAYGRGPGHKALPDSVMLQEMMRATMRSAQNAVRPPLIKVSDGVLTPVRLGPGGITTARRDVMSGNMRPVVPLLDGGRPDIGEEMMRGVRERITRAYFNHLLVMERDPRMTATQVLKIDEEQIRVLGPFLGRLQVEYLAPMVERVVGLLLRAGALRPVPTILAGRQVRVEFVSPIVRAQRLAEVNALTSAYEATRQIAAIEPGVDDNVDHDRAYRLVYERLGVPADVMRAPRRVSEMRTARVQEQQGQAAVETFSKVAPAMQSAAQAADGMANDNNTRPAAEAG